MSDGLWCFFNSWTGWLVMFLAASAAAFLLWTHTGHVISLLPYLIILACPLMHLFGHRHGHGGQR